MHHLEGFTWKPRAWEPTWRPKSPDQDPHGEGPTAKEQGCPVMLRDDGRTRYLYVSGFESGDTVEVRVMRGYPKTGMKPPGRPTLSIPADQLLDVADALVYVHRCTHEREYDAALHAAGANTAHGLRRTRADKHRAVSLLLRDKEWAARSDREIAQRCGVSARYVSKLRRELRTVLADEFVSHLRELLQRRRVEVTATRRSAPRPRRRSPG